MIDKMTSGAAGQMDISLLKNSVEQEGEGGKISIFQSLLHALRGDSVPAYGADNAGGAESQGESAGDGWDTKIPSDNVIAELHGLAERHLSGEEADRLMQAIESGQVQNMAKEVGRLLEVVRLSSEGNLNGEDGKGGLVELLSRLKQDGQAPPAKLKELLNGLGQNEQAQPDQLKELINQLKQNEQAQPVRLKELRSQIKQQARGPAEQLPEAGGKTEAEKSVGTPQKIDTARNRSMEIESKQKKALDTFLLKGTSAGISEKGLEMKSASPQKSRKEEARDSLETGTVRSGGRESGRRSFLGLSPLSSRAHLDNGGSAGGDATGSKADALSFFDGEQEIMWEEYATDSTEKMEKKEAGKQMVASSPLTLGQVPIANGTLRKEILPGLTKNILQTASEAKKTPEQWQKHHFVLDDGKDVQLSVRESKGVLQVKMGSLNLDLNKLLQQHLQQIREHLRQEFGSEIDLQLGHPGEEDTASHLPEDPANRRNESRVGSGGGEAGSEDPENVKFKAVRHFGYNRMEWTA